MDEQKNKRKAYLTMILWIAVIVLDVAVLTVLAILGKLQAEVLVAAIVISVFIACIGAFVVFRTYKDHIKPSLRDEKTGDSTYELRVEKMKEGGKVRICLRSATISAASTSRRCTWSSGYFLCCCRSLSY